MENLEISSENDEEKYSFTQRRTARDFMKLAHRTSILGSIVMSILVFCVFGLATYGFLAFFHILSHDLFNQYFYAIAVGFFAWWYYYYLNMSAKIVMLNDFSKTKKIDESKVVVYATRIYEKSDMGESLYELKFITRSVIKKQKVTLYLRATGLVHIFEEKDLDAGYDWEGFKSFIKTNYDVKKKAKS
ncbi:hypothetical protein [Lactococcus cremoris]|uniref:YcxB-like protein domain-containing protein n=1 Tax=Lactococcus lactis subsp. cremoris TaxID=1359 RepID=A0AAX4A4Q6_LACLC|nr:hypothetical protein [Lactococcus cremoris]KGH34402.1 hypothetical protein JL36_00625 [Lactococcus cremoris]QSE64503.1 hypothetical protein JWR96_05145 [Lactococcus cremoris]WMX70197.1 hypothetical protein RF668_09870 [Lactococcus cremoris]